MAGELDIILEDFLHVLHSKIINSFFGLPLRINKIEYEECREMRNSPTINLKYPLDLSDRA